MTRRGEAPDVRHGPERAALDAASDAELLAPGLLHELRQPLMGLEAAAALLERAAGGLADAEDWRLLRAQISRLSEIVRSWGELFQPGEPGSAFDVEAVVARTVGLLAHRIRPLAGRFTYEPGTGGREGWGAPGALVHAATNVLANALDAVEGTGAPARVEVRVIEGPDGRVEVRVSDEGPGIPAGDRARVFEPRFTTKRTAGGRGLGLHLSRRLMNRWGGELFLVVAADPSRLPWASTEFSIAVPPPPGGAR